MAGLLRLHLIPLCLPLATLLAAISGCGARTAPLTPASTLPTAPSRPSSAAPAQAAAVYPVMLGIDVLESTGFAAVSGKKIGLLTHPAGVSRRGESTISVLRRARNTRLLALFAPEHSLYGDVKAGENVDDARDSRTGLPVYSLHGANRKPTPAQLKGLDALVIDLQDIGVRSYTYNVAMRYAMDACFASGVEVIVLDRPNPLGGLKVDGPLLDREWMSGVGAFRIPYVHGLTMGELARFAAGTPGVLDVPESARVKGRLTIVPMRGWRRGMLWSDTGLTYIPTSPMIRDFPAAVGYAMVGLGCEYSGFKHGLGKEHPFRAITYKGKTTEELLRDFNAFRLPGVSFRPIYGLDAQGRTTSAVYVDIADWNAWNPTQLSFELMRLACRYNPPNPFAALGPKESRSFNIHTGSTAWWLALNRDGARVDLDAFTARWQIEADAYRNLSRKFWLYTP